MSECSQKSGRIPISVAWERTQESAACADSFITSPSCPVSVNALLARMRVASRNRVPPPARAGIAADQDARGPVRPPDVLALDEAMVGRLLGDQVLPRDVDLSLLRVAGDLDYLHAVAG